MDAESATALLRLAEELSAGVGGPDAKSSLNRLEDSAPELLSAMQWFIDAERTDDGLRLANAMYRFWISKQRFDEGAQWFERALCASWSGAAAASPGLVTRSSVVPEQRPVDAAGCRPMLRRRLRT